MNSKHLGLGRRQVTLAGALTCTLAGALVAVLEVAFADTLLVLGFFYNIIWL